MKLMFILLPIVYLSANAYLFWRVLQTLSGLPLWAKVVVGILFWFAAFSLFISFGLKDTALPQTIHRILFNVGAVWMVFLLYSVLLLLAFDLIHHFVPSLGSGLKYVLPLVCLLMIYGYINYRNPSVEHIDMAVEGQMDGEITAVAISDVHLGHGTGPEDLARYVDRINAQNPDVIFIAGDLIDNSVRPLLVEPFDDVLSRLNAPMGIYMVPGNHEYISGIEDVADYLANRTRIRLLRDEMVELPCGLQIVGRDDRSNENRHSLDSLLARTDPLKPVLVLDHQPYELAQTDAAGVDIQISGHTHNGQLWPLNHLVDMMYEQGHGYRKWSHAHIYVSSGLSLWGPPFRIGTESDFAVLKIYRRPE